MKINIKKHYKNITITLLISSVIIFVAYISGAFMTPQEKIEEAIKDNNLVSNYEIEKSNTRINTISEQIKLLTIDKNLLEECKNYNTKRLGTIKEPKVCDIRILRLHGTKNTKDTNISKNNKDFSKAQNLALENNVFKHFPKLKFCRITQGELMHINKWNGESGGEVYATDIACTRGQNFKIYSSNHSKTYIVKYVGYLRGGTGDTIILTDGTKQYLYGHTETKLKVGDIVKANQYIGVSNLSGVSKGYHLHFEIWEGKKNISSQGLVNPHSERLWNKRWEVKTVNLRKQIDNLLTRYGRQEDINNNRWKRVSDKYFIKEEVLVCIAQIETHLGRHLKTPHNYGNIGNTDGGKTIGYNTSIDGIEAIGRQLSTGTYLKGNRTVGDLMKDNGTNDTKRYASDPNWGNNLMSCLGQIHGKNIDKDFIIKK